METIVGYDSDSSGDERPSGMLVNTAPAVATEVATEQYVPTGSKVLTHNPTAEELWTPAQGPENPFKPNTRSFNQLQGHAEGMHMNEFQFQEQYNSFQTLGFAYDPSDRSTNSFVQSNHEAAKHLKKQGTGGLLYERKKSERKRLSQQAYDNLSRKNFRVDTSSEEKPTEQGTGEGTSTKASSGQSTSTDDSVQAIRHLKATRDALGRSFVDPPSSLKPKDYAIEQSFIPKREARVFSGHTKGVAMVRWLPKYGHLLLSAGLDGNVKIWDVYEHKQCVMTYTAHKKAVRAVDFSNDGRHFLSCGYDRSAIYWDTETGKAISTLTNNKVMYCIKFNPEPSKQNEFIAGAQDRRIYQWDVRSGNIVQEYNEHLGPVNSVTFVDENRRFVSSSDDKTLRVWDYGVPVQIKYIADPDMHSMPAVAAHPNGNWIACQSMDNQILVYGCKDKFKMNKKKRFLGHSNSGYACEMTFSQDGKFIASGDAEGRLFFWDWKTSKKYRVLNAHKGVCISCAWHPIDNSRVATCGWDGLIKLWE